MEKGGTTYEWPNVGGSALVRIAGRTALVTIRGVKNENSKPAFQLYVADHKHPTPTGTYLAACVFYRTLYDAPAAGLPHRIEWKEKVLVDLSKQDAAALQKIADAVPLAAAK